MPNLKEIINYWRHYGAYSLIGHAWEAVAVNPYRFRAGHQRNVPQLIQKYTAPEIQNCVNSVSRKMKICYLIHYFYPIKQGGTERFVLNLAKQQQQFGNDVIVITLGRESINKYEKKIENMFFHEYNYEGISVFEIRHKKAPLGFNFKDIVDNDFVMYKFAKELLKNEQIDVVHVTYPQPFYNFTKAAHDSNIPVVMTCTDFNLFCHYATMVDRKGDFCVGSNKGIKCKQICKTYGCSDLEKRYERAKQYIANVQWVTVPSEFVANIYINEFPDTQIQIVPHGISEAFVPNANRVDTKRFVYAGALSELKGVHLLIEAFERMQGDYRLDIYGSHNSVNAKKLIQTKDERIHFHGAVKAHQMDDVYQQADCVIVPSICYETYNFVVREALACGCLVIASDIGAMPEAIDIGENGFVFVPGDVESLYETMLQAIEFDWENYKQKIFPTLLQEGQTYNQIYQRLVQSI